MKRNFLMGKGERLVDDVTGVRGGGPKHHPYTFAQVKARLKPMLTGVVGAIARLPDVACPDDQAIATVTLNPEYIAKSYFPDDLFKYLHIEAVGSRPRRILPEKRSKDRVPEEAVTTELFVIGPRSAFRQWEATLPNWSELSPAMAEIRTIENRGTHYLRENKGQAANPGRSCI